MAKNIEPNEIGGKQYLLLSNMVKEEDFIEEMPANVNPYDKYGDIEHVFEFSYLY